MAFVHLHNHTEYSLQDGVTHVRAMVRRAADLGMPAIAITDHAVMSGAVELENECLKLRRETGQVVKPIFGCEVYFTDSIDEHGEPNYEDLDALDIELFNRNMNDLLAGETVDMPVFDFITLINWAHHAVAQRRYYGQI